MERRTQVINQFGLFLSEVPWRFCGTSYRTMRLFGAKNEKVEIIAVLREVPLFQDLSHREFEKLETIVHKRSYLSSEIIFEEMEPGVGLYIVQEGKVKITSQLHGREVVITEMGKGDFFGELSLLDDKPRSATAMAIEESKLLGFYRPDLMELIDASPRLGARILFNLSRILAERLRETTYTLVEKRNESRSS